MYSVYSLCNAFGVLILNLSCLLQIHIATPTIIEHITNELHEAMRTTHDISNPKNVFLSWLWHNVPVVSSEPSAQ